MVTKTGQGLSRARFKGRGRRFTRRHNRILDRTIVFLINLYPGYVHPQYGPLMPLEGYLL